MLILNTHEPQSSCSDPATAEGVESVKASITDAQQGIRTIAAALLARQMAPAAARDQIKTDLLAANSTLSGLTS